MLLSAVLFLTSTTSVPIFGALGRPTQAWFLNQIMRKRQRLAAALHDEGGIKPFTVSTLLDRNGRPHQAGDWLKEGQECWLRVTTIGEELSETFVVNVLKKLPKTITLYKMGFRINGYTLNPREYPWAGQTTFAEIAQDSQYSKVSREVRMEFVSPTAFRNNRRDIALPIPGKVFRSLSEKWNTFCPETMQIQAQWPGFADDCIIVNEMTAVNTVYWEFAERTRGAATGFTGTVEFLLLPKTNAPKDWQPYWDGADVVMQSLAHFAFYSGVGHHSTIGMGQARVIPDQKPVLVSRKDSSLKLLRR